MLPETNFHSVTQVSHCLVYIKKNINAWWAYTVSTNDSLSFDSILYIIELLMYLPIQMSKECSFPLYGPWCPGTVRYGITSSVSMCIKDAHEGTLPTEIIGLEVTSNVPCQQVMGL